MNYFKIYEKLYSLGYHSKMKNHGQRYVDSICKGFNFKTILEIGCSNGLAVRQFQKRRRLAYGIDVSHIAIRYAGEKSFVPNCIMASANNIPFVDGFVDAVFSCDVFEHLQEKDVHKALREVRRLSKKYFFIVLDCDVERNKEWIRKGKEKWPADFAGIKNLHLTVWPETKWKEVIQKYGFKFISRAEDLFCFEKI